MRAATVSAVHAAGASGLLAGATGQGALELEHGTGDLVAHGGLAALVVDGRRVGDGAAAAGEEAAASALGGAGCLGGGVVVGCVGGRAAAGEDAAAGGGGGCVAGGSERHDCGFWERRVCLSGLGCLDDGVDLKSFVVCFD